MFQICDALTALGRDDLKLTVSKEDILALIGLVNPIETLAFKRKEKLHNTLRGDDWDWLQTHTELSEGDSALVAEVKAHIREELVSLESLQLVTKCKRIVTYFRRSGLNDKLDTTLKQECETRWNSILTMLESFRKSEGLVPKVCFNIECRLN